MNIYAICREIGFCAKVLNLMLYLVVRIDYAHCYEISVINDGEADYLNPRELSEREVAPNFLVYVNKLINTYAGDVNLTIN